MGAELNYSSLDRLIHRIAFGAPSLQLTAADIERALYGGWYGAAHAERPIFITSLPRAGTTLLLEALSLFPSLASHTYRDMPFVMAPVLWSRLSGGFRKRAELAERAHGDGVQVGYDSPEAFEEILWKAFWPDKYTDTGIDLWDASDDEPDAREFFVEHMKKIVALRRPGRLGDGRYISKNNANIARLDLIGSMFPDASVVVPFRRPVEHAVSLLRQHRNFAELHGKSPFALRYMADIGHYEFGDLHRPVAFPEAGALTANRDPMTVDYWLGYWIAAFEHVLAHRERVFLVSYESACRDSRAVLGGLCARLGIDDEGALVEAAALFKDAPPPRGGGIDLDDALRSRAESLHETLVAAQSG